MGVVEPFIKKCVDWMMWYRHSILQDYRQSENTFSSDLATESNLWVTNFQHIKDRMYKITFKAGSMDEEYGFVCSI